MGSPKKAAAQVASLRAKALAPSELSSEEIWTSYGLAFVAAALGPGGGVFRLGLGVGVVLAEQALEHLAAGGGADGVADTVVLGKGLDLVEVVLQVKVLPAVGIANRNVEGHVQALSR